VTRSGWEGDGFRMKPDSNSTCFTNGRRRGNLANLERFIGIFYCELKHKGNLLEFSLPAVFFAFIVPKALRETLNTTCVPSENLVLWTSTDSVRIRARLWRVLQKILES